MQKIFKAKLNDIEAGNTATLNIPENHYIHQVLCATDTYVILVLQEENPPRGRLTATEADMPDRGLAVTANRNW